MGDAVAISRRTGAPIVATYELAQRVAREGAKSVGMNIGGTVKFEGIEISMVPAFHTCEVGAPTGFVIRGEGKSVYHAGDTGLFYDMKVIGEVYRPTVALLPVGGHFTMDPDLAAIAVEYLRPKYAIPMHYNTFDIIKQDPARFAELVKERGLDTEVVILKPGEAFDF